MNPNDDSSLIITDLFRVLTMSKDERHVAAYHLYNDVIQRMKTYVTDGNDDPHRLLYDDDLILDSGSLENAKSSSSNSNSNRTSHSRYQNGVVGLVMTLLYDKRKEFENVKARGREFLSAQYNLNVENADAEWLYAQTMFGISTHYRVEEDNSLTVKLEGELSGVSLFEQLCVLREVDMYNEWAPFCSKSVLLRQIGRIDVIAHHVITVPFLFLSREVIFQAKGCDCMKEDGSILISAKSAEQEEFPDVNFPPKPRRYGSDRMHVKEFQAQIDVISPTCARTRVIANIDPKLFLPQWLINFSMKKIAGIMLVYLLRMAKKIEKSPECPHGKRIVEDKSFYLEWVWPKFVEYCEELDWSLPIINVFRNVDMNVKSSESEDGENSVKSQSSKKSTRSLKSINKVIFGRPLRHRKKKQQQTKEDQFTNDYKAYPEEDELRFQKLKKIRDDLNREHEPAKSKSLQVIHVSHPILMACFFIIYFVDESGLIQAYNSSFLFAIFCVFLMISNIILSTYSMRTMIGLVKEMKSFQLIGPLLQLTDEFVFYMNTFISVVVIIFCFASTYEYDQDSVWQGQCIRLIRHFFVHISAFLTLFGFSLNFVLKEKEANTLTRSLLPLREG